MSLFGAVWEAKLCVFGAGVRGMWKNPCLIVPVSRIWSGNR